MFKKFRVLFLVTIVLIVFAGAASAYESAFKDVSVTIDGEGMTRYRVLEKTIAQFLKDENIVLEDKDKINVPLDLLITYSVDIEIQRGYDVTVKIDNKSRQMRVEPGLKVGNIVSSLTEAAGFEADNKDGVEIEFVYTGGLLSDDVEEGQVISLATRKTETEVSQEPISFETIVQEEPEKFIGEESVVTEGVEGKKEITRKKVYESGVLLEDYISDEVVVEGPVNKVIAKGTKAVPKPEVVAEKTYSNQSNGDISALISASKNLKNHSRLLDALAATRSSFNNVVPDSYKEVYTMTATAYTNGPGQTGKSPGDAYYGITASGVPTRLGIVAVDRSVIPLGSVLYVKGYGYAIAADTGGAIRGNKIDLFFDSYNECIQYGRRSTTVYLVS
jgi:3D (Asp-Asp-Asp) domain-containing protein/uncharacterized protein YabE (DUF348 family)